MQDFISNLSNRNSLEDEKRKIQISFKDRQLSSLIQIENEYEELP
jgi:hypothetical protein